MKKIHILLAILLAFFVGFNVGGYYYQPPYFQALYNATSYVSLIGFAEVEPTINLTTIHLTGGCSEISFDVTADQAYSIARGLDKSLGSRPLTHDMIRDILDVFEIKILQIKIDRYRSDIYYATLVLQKDSRILELDIRPSDAIALASRTGTKLYMRQSILEANGRVVC